jgi:hypothetical protein
MILNYEDDYLDDDGTGEWDEDDEEQFDCGVYRDGNGRILGCGMAGSEECDFECPYRESVERSLRAQAGWVKRKAKQKLAKESSESKPEADAAKPIVGMGR